MPGSSNQSDRRLTRREREVLQQAALGLSNRQIGEELQIAEQTVKNHLSNAMRKLEIRDRTSAVVLALGQGLISLPILPAAEGAVGLKRVPEGAAGQPVHAEDGSLQALAVLTDGTSDA